MWLLKSTFNTLRDQKWHDKLIYGAECVNYSLPFNPHFKRYNAKNYSTDVFKWYLSQKLGFIKNINI